MGWILVDRSITDAWFWEVNRSRHEKFSKGQAFLDLLLSVNHKPYYNQLFKDKFYEVGAGELIFSQKALAEKWNWDNDTVGRFLKKLESTGSITLDIRKGECTQISFKNWEKYQHPQGGMPKGMPEGMPIPMPKGSPYNQININNNKKEKEKECFDEQKNNFAESADCESEGDGFCECWMITEEGERIDIDLKDLKSDDDNENSPWLFEDRKGNLYKSEVGCGFKLVKKAEPKEPVTEEPAEERKSYLDYIDFDFSKCENEDDLPTITYAEAEEYKRRTGKEWEGYMLG